MSQYMDLAIDIIDQLKQQIGAFDPKDIKNIPTVVFVERLDLELSGRAFTREQIDKIINGMSIDISNDVDKETVEYLASGHADVLELMHEKIGDLMFQPYIINGISMEFKTNG